MHGQTYIKFNKKDLHYVSFLLNVPYKMDAVCRVQYSDLLPAERSEFRILAGTRHIFKYETSEATLEPSHLLLKVVPEIFNRC